MGNNSRLLTIGYLLAPVAVAVGRHLAQYCGLLMLLALTPSRPLGGGSSWTLFILVLL